MECFGGGVRYVGIEPTLYAYCTGKVREVNE